MPAICGGTTVHLALIQSVRSFYFIKIEIFQSDGFWNDKKILNLPNGFNVSTL